MATFTINSLSAGSPASTDNILKSDTSGVLTKVPVSTLATKIIEDGGLGWTTASVSLTSVIGGTGTIIQFCQIGSYLIGIKLAGSAAVTLTTGAWTTLCALPSGISPFGVVGIRIPDSLAIMLRHRNGNIEYLATSASAWWQGSGLAFAN